MFDLEQACPPWLWKPVVAFVRFHTGGGGVWRCGAEILNFWEPKYFKLLLAASKYVKYYNGENTSARNLGISVRSGYTIPNNIKLIPMFRILD